MIACDPPFPVQSFSISDFPLPRKTPFWNHFPSQTSLSHSPVPTTPFSYPKLISQTESPSFEEWTKIIHKFKASKIPKVVLARKTTLTFKNPVSPISLLHFLKKRSPNAFTFAILLSPNHAFVGATPEKLFSRKGKHLETEALAGTATHFGPKEHQEFRYVKETLTQQLQTICKPFNTSNEVFIKKAGNVSHLHYPFSVELHSPLSNTKLIQFLHPTPAIGGYPRDEALSFIYEHEPFDRGWYAGTLSIDSEEEAHTYVTIRSCMIENNQMYIFTGAGITQDSDPKKEWEELNLKQNLFFL